MYAGGSPSSCSVQASSSLGGAGIAQGRSSPLSLLTCIQFSLDMCHDTVRQCLRVLSAPLKLAKLNHDKGMRFQFDS